MTTIIGIKWYSIVMYALFNMVIPTHKELWRPAHFRTTNAIVNRIGPGSDAVAADASFRHYTYVFEGQATYEGKPCDQAEVVVWVTTPRQELLKRASTDANGNYSIEMTIEGSRNEPVDWAMQAFSTASKPVQLVGRRIIMTEDTTTVVNNPFALDRS